MDSSYTNVRVPVKFTKLVKCYYDNAKTIEEYWKMAGIAAYKNCLEKKDSLVLEIAITSFKQLIRKVKISKVSKPIAYFYSIAERMFNSMYYEEVFEIRYNLEGVV